MSELMVAEKSGVSGPFRFDVTENDVLIQPITRLPSAKLQLDIWHDWVSVLSDWIDTRTGYKTSIKGADLRYSVIRVSNGCFRIAEFGENRDRLLRPWMLPLEEHRHKAENYVSSPPALIIFDDDGTAWTLGFVTAPHWISPRGEFAFNVLRNGKETGEIASRIEKRRGVRIFTRRGWKRWTGCDFV